jgi:hypothetical protein
MSPLVALCICLAAIAPPQTSSESRAAVEGRPTSAVAAPTTSAERLLGDAFDVASAIPTDPHIKDRSLSQYEIVAAWITLGSPERARACAEGIAPQSWRRGAAFGDIACHYAKCGDVKGAQDCLVAANVVAATQTEWRLDRIRERMAEAQRILLAGDVRPTSESIAARRAEIDRLVASADLDQLRVAARLSIDDYRARFDDPTAREDAERATRAVWAKLPLDLQIDACLSLADIAIERRDLDVARRLADEANQMLDRARWGAEGKAPVLARIAYAWHRVGDSAKAAALLDAALAHVEASRAQIMSMDLADQLRPIAECHQRLGNAEVAARVYRQTIEAGAENPNARPRAIDLAATLRSMALVGFEPDAATTARIHEIRVSLGSPW